jgi:flagellar protein FlaG
MPIDNIAQISGAQMRSAAAKPAAPSSADGVTTRQPLPGNGDPIPPVMATPPVAEVKEAVSRLNAYVQTLRRDLQFRVDEDTDRVIVTVTDSETHEVIRQIPAEEVLAVAKSLETMQGVLMDTKA